MSCLWPDIVVSHRCLLFALYIQRMNISKIRAPLKFPYFIIIFLSVVSLKRALCLCSDSICKHNLQYRTCAITPAFFFYFFGFVCSLVSLLSNNLTVHRVNYFWTQHALYSSASYYLTVTSRAFYHLLWIFFFARAEASVDACRQQQYQQKSQYLDIAMYMHKSASSVRCSQQQRKCDSWNAWYKKKVSESTRHRNTERKNNQVKRWTWNYFDLPAVISIHFICHFLSLCLFRKAAVKNDPVNVLRWYLFCY